MISTCLGLAVLVATDLQAQRTPATTAPVPPGHAYAVLVGIEEYSGNGPRALHYAAKDTELFQRHLASDRGGNLGQQNLNQFLTPGKGGRKHEILTTLYQIVTKEAGGNDVIYIVVTARSQAPVLSDDVFISVADSLPEKPDSQISLSELHDILQENRDVRKILFADLSGEPTAKGWAPLKGRMERRLAIDNLTGVLASDSETGSQEDANLQGGHRVFSYLLLAGLQSKNGQVNGVLIDKNADNIISFSEIRDFLEQYVPKFTQNMPASPKVMQKPVRFGDTRASDVQLSDLRKPGLSDFALRPRRSPMLLASNGTFAALRIPIAGGPEDEPLSTQSREILDRFSSDLQQGNLIGPGGAKDLLEQLKTLITDPKLLALQSALFTAALRDQAQQAITRYGTGDRFTVDPRWQEVEAKDNSFDVALQDYDMVLQLEPGAADAGKIQARQHFCRGRVAMLKGDRTTAENEFTLAIGLDAKFAEPHNALGVLRFQLAGFDEAIREFHVAGRIAPLWAYPRYNTALAEVELGRYDLAVAEYREAIRNMPYYPYLHHNFAVVLQRLNRLDEAEAEYRTTLALFGSEEQDAALRTQHWTRAGNSAETQAAMLQSELLHRNIASTEIAYGVLMELRGKTKAALASYQAALVHYPGFVLGVHNLALLQMESGDLNSAVQLLEKNLQENATFEPSRLALGDAYLRLNRYADAARVYSEANPSNLAVITGLAKALAGEGRTDAAMEGLNRAIQGQQASGGVSPRLYVARGDVDESLKNPQAACNDYNAAAKGLRNVLEQKDLTARIKQSLKRCKSQSVGH
jgi:tetratricopeptide (TPR) repeat protein